MGERPTLILTTRLGVRPLGVRGDPRAEPCLADPRLARDEHDPPVARAYALPGADEPIEL